MHVLEVGSGSDAFTTDVARAVGPEGRVVAYDIQADMLHQLADKLPRPENPDVPPFAIVRGGGRARKRDSSRRRRRAAFSTTRCGFGGRKALFYPAP